MPARSPRPPGATDRIRALAAVAAVVGIGVAVLTAVVGSVTDERRVDNGSVTIVTTARTEPPASEASASGFVTIHDDQHRLSVDVPVEWDEIEGLPDSVGDPTLDASTDLERFKRSFAVPGLSIAILGRGTAPTVEGRMSELLDQLGAIEACPTPVGEQGDDVRYLVTRSDCEGQDFDLTVTLEALDSGDDLAVLVQTESARHASVTPIVLGTFRYDG